MTMFDGMVTIYGIEQRISKNGKAYFIIAVEKGIDILKLYCGLDKIPDLKRGDTCELTIDINSYDKPIVTKIIK